MPFIVTTLPEMSRNGCEFTRIGAEEEDVFCTDCWAAGADVVVEAGFVVVVVVGVDAG